MLARWLALRPKVLIVDEPTRGIDVGAKVEVHNLLFEMARSGIAVIAISSELPEVLAISDRIVTMREGRVTGASQPREGQSGTADVDDDVEPLARLERHVGERDNERRRRQQRRGGSMPSGSLPASRR